MRFSSQGKIGRDKKNTYPKPKQSINGSFLIDDGESHMTLRYKVESGFCKIFFFLFGHHKTELCWSANRTERNDAKCLLSRREMFINQAQNVH